MSSGHPTEQAEHVHQWQPNGVTKQDEIAYSPVSANDHRVRTVEYAVQSCSCGKVKRTVVGAGRWRRLR